MDGKTIIEKVAALDFPAGSYIVFGSCPLALAGLRTSQDVDMLVSEELLAKLEQSGWVQINKGGNDKPFTHDIFEAHSSWNFSSYNPTLEQLLKTAVVAEGIPFVSLEEVRKWKVSSGRPKDLHDVELIDNYFANKN